MSSTQTALQATLLFLPLGNRTHPWALQFSQFAMESFRQWTDMTVIYSAGIDATFERGKTYVLGYEPHSVLPFALPMFLGPQAPCKDPHLGESRVLATSLVSALENAA